VRAWGDNTWGQCDVPVCAPRLVAISAAGSHSLALTSDGSVMGWGSNAYGKCEAPEPNAGYIAVAAGYSFSLAIRAYGPAVAPDREPLRALHISSISPNPFGPNTTVVFELPQATDGKLSVFDASGRLVRTLWRGALAAGSHRITWDGSDEGARGLPSGIYLMRLETGAGNTRTAKVVLTR